MLRWGTVAGLAWLGPVATLLARAAEREPRGKPARSVIILWMAGGPSQLETFDPHPGTVIAHGTRSIRTAVPEIELADGFERLAERMSDVALVRSLVSKEADHERAVYTMKSGYRPNPTLVHPSIGAVICHETEDAGLDIPRHVSILPDQWPARGGFLGAQYDAFQIRDPKEPVQDVERRVAREKMAARLDDVSVVDRAFAAGRIRDADIGAAVHARTTERATRVMDSAQLEAFDVNRVPASERAAYGDTPFGRGCLAALRLIERGVRCVEVTLGGWDTHARNHPAQRARVEVLDPAFSALLRDLKARGLLDSTIVLCGGEFGRTPKVNPLEGRDHWPHGFSVALAGGGIRGGRVLGGTDPLGEKRDPKDPVAVQDLHATIQHALGLDPRKEIRTPVGRPIALSDGRVIEGLLRG